MAKFWFSLQQKKDAERRNRTRTGLIMNLKGELQFIRTNHVITENLEVKEYTQMSNKKPNFEDSILVADVDQYRIIHDGKPISEEVENLLKQVKIKNNIEEFLK